MTREEAKNILIEHNKWRRCNEDVCKCEMQKPKDIGVAIDKAIDIL